MAEFIFDIENGSLFNVEQESLIETDCASQFVYKVNATELDSIDIELQGSFLSAKYILAGSSSGWDGSSTTLSFNTDLYIEFIIDNSGSPGVFNQVTLVVQNTTANQNYVSEVSRQNDSLPCDSQGVGARNYDELDDTPENKTGSSLKIIRVTQDESKHEYININSILTKETEDVGNVIDLGYIGGHTTNVLSPNSVTSYSSIVNEVLNGNQTTLINTSSEPTISNNLEIDISGTSGSFSINIGEYSYVVSFSGSLSNTVTTFIITQGTTVLVDTGLTISGSGNKLIVSGPLSDIIYTSNISGDLSGEISGIQIKKVFGADFEADTDMKMCFEYNGKFVEYYFLKYNV